ncbi:imidazolonepropionase-like amidohydrolase [Kribbella aluminosa]|uniref:Imidazolonepropionase-like amidohydrolase n=1 Tax=Kribbella aluminosa TaxID=416017 RepID=A0ABS4UPU0_9ACTN|nr:amidohydrolase family protein [Kribbella aluminosa]MBP2353642.1 imidazolonepropionase-like amidohydrolase [Kribbella aluminosa]
MTTWVFEGTVLPAGGTARLTFGQDPTGEQLPGRYAVPGLVDSHCHLTFDATPDGPVLRGEDFAAERLAELAGAGVSALRDVGGNRDVTLRLARDADDGRPLVLAAGRFLAPAGQYFPRAYEPVAPEDLLAAVEAEIADGATWLKLVGDFPDVGPDGPIRGSKTRPTYDLELVAAMVELAHSRNARVAAHVDTDHVTGLIQAGIDSVEHGTALTEQDLEALGARGGAWTPTLSASVSPRPDETPERRARREERSAYLASVLPLAERYGVHVLTGSDVVGTVAAEIDMLVKHGLTVEQAITAASTGAQDFLGLSGTGNLVTYDADPREHPDVLARPAAVVLNGRRIA